MYSPRKSPRKNNNNNNNNNKINVFDRLMPPEKIQDAKSILDLLLYVIYRAENLKKISAWSMLKKNVIDKRLEEIVSGCFFHPFILFRLTRNYPSNIYIHGQSYIYSLFFHGLFFFYTFFFLHTHTHNRFYI